MTRAAAVLPLLLLPFGACAMGPTHDPLGVAIQRYYAAHAQEEDGRCRQPRIDTISERRVLERHGQASRLYVRYSYFDPSVNMDTTWDSLFNKALACSGFAERDFDIEQTEIGYRVTGMSAPVAPSGGG